MNKHSPAKCVIRATEIRQIENRLQPPVYVPLKSNREQIMAGDFRLSGIYDYNNKPVVSAGR